VSDVPVLLLVGDMDATTTPAWSYAIARGLSNSRVVSMPHGGHNFRGWGDDEAAARCFDEIAVAFYSRGEATSLDVSCAERVRPPGFALP
ncbi:MAG: alpha/beta hydrolase, partial [Xanthomonadales bacterium]|nr:alpha/beta hydrolase [Xanthomonadales bacterium]